MIHPQQAPTITRWLKDQYTHWVKEAVRIVSSGPWLHGWLKSFVMTGSRYFHYHIPLCPGSFPEGRDHFLISFLVKTDKECYKPCGLKPFKRTFFWCLLRTSWLAFSQFLKNKSLLIPNTASEEGFPSCSQTCGFPWAAPIPPAQTYLTSWNGSVWSRKTDLLPVHAVCSAWHSNWHENRAGLGPHSRGEEENNVKKKAK